MTRIQIKCTYQEADTFAAKNVTHHINKDGTLEVKQDSTRIIYSPHHWRRIIIQSDN